MSVGNFIVDIVGGSKINKQAKREARAREAIENRRALRERVASVRESQILAAKSQVLSENLGVGQSSGAEGQQASIQSTTAGNQSFVNQVQSLNEIRSDAMSRAASIQNTVSTIKGAIELGTSIAKAGAG